MSSEIRDINLAESGERKIEWVKRNCDLLRTLEKEFSETYYQTFCFLYRGIHCRVRGNKYEACVKFCYRWIDKAL